MSDVIKPEHECPFDPKHYQCDCFIAPVGSFSWALIQLKLRKRVARSVWDDKGMYLAITPRVNELTVEKDSAYAVDGVAVGTKYDYLTHIDLRNEHGNFVPWQPTQEDMMACDWKFFEDKVKPELKPEPEEKPEPTPDPKPELEPEQKPEPKPEVDPFPESALRMKGILTSGYIKGKDRYKYTGYSDGFNIGEWKEISNNTPIENMKMISLVEDNILSDYYYLRIDSDNKSSAKEELRSKKLIINCLGEYHEFSDERVTESNYTLSYAMGLQSVARTLLSKFNSSMSNPLEIELIFVDKDFKLNKP